MPAVLSPSAKQQFFFNDGAPAAGGKLYTYSANTTTPRATFTNRAGTVANDNPIILDARGEAIIYLTPGVAYDYVLHDDQDVLIWTREDVIASFGDSNAVGFLQNGDGAVERPAQEKMAETISVKDFGALGDGITDDTLAWTNAITHAASISSGTYGGSELYAPAGQYMLSSAVVVPINKPIVIRGDGPGKTIIRQTGAAAHGITFESNNFLVFGGGVRDLTIEAGAGLECSGSFGTGSTGSGIKATRANDNFAIENVNINNFTTGLELLGCWYTRVRNFRIIFCDAHGVLIDKAADGTVGAGNDLIGGKISNNGFTGGVAGSTGFRVRASGGDFLCNTDITSFEKGWVADPRTGDSVLYFFGSNVLADTCTGDGFTFDGTNGNVWSCHFNNSWAAFNSGHGISVTGTKVKAVNFWGRVRENALHGINMLGGGFYFRGGDIQSNSRGFSGVSDGVSVAAGVSGWAVQDATIGNDGTSTFTHQRNGITVAAGASDNYIVNGCNFVGNLTVPISDGGSGQQKNISGNLPIGTTGVNPTTAIIYSSASNTSPAAGTTGYIGSPGYNASVNLVEWRAPRTGVITNIQAYVNTAPGAAQTFTYALYKNGAATALTCQIAGAGAFSAAGSSPAIAMAPGDAFSVRVVTSAGAAAAAHSVLLKFE